MTRGRFARLPRSQQKAGDGSHSRVHSLPRPNYPRDVPRTVEPTTRMPISLQCPGCGERWKANDNLAGRRLPCPKCRQEIQVPERKVEDEAAALLLEGESETPAAPPAFTTSPFATAPQVPTK